MTQDKNGLLGDMLAPCATSAGQVRQITARSRNSLCRVLVARSARHIRIWLRHFPPWLGLDQLKHPANLFGFWSGLGKAVYLLSLLDCKAALCLVPAYGDKLVDKANIPIALTQSNK